MSTPPRTHSLPARRDEKGPLGTQQEFVSGRFLVPLKSLPSPLLDRRHRKRTSGRLRVLARHRPRKSRYRRTCDPGTGPSEVRVKAALLRSASR